MVPILLDCAKCKESYIDMELGEGKIMLHAYHDVFKKHVLTSSSDDHRIYEKVSLNGYTLSKKSFTEFIEILFSLGFSRDFHGLYYQSILVLTWKDLT